MQVTQKVAIFPMNGKAGNSFRHVASSVGPLFKCSVQIYHCPHVRTFTLQKQCPTHFSGGIVARDNEKGFFIVGRKQKFISASQLDRVVESFFKFSPHRGGSHTSSGALLVTIKGITCYPPQLNLFHYHKNTNVLHKSN